MSIGQIKKRQDPVPRLTRRDLCDITQARDVTHARDADLTISPACAGVIRDAADRADVLCGELGNNAAAVKDRAPSAKSSTTDRKDDDDDRLFRSS